MRQIFTSTNSVVERSDIHDEGSLITHKPKENATKRMTLTTLGLATLAVTLLLGAGPSQAADRLNVASEVFVGNQCNPSYEEDGMRWNSNGSVTSECRASAPIQLPIGAQITQAFCRVQDSVGSDYWSIKAQLKKRNSSQSAPFVLLTTQTSTDRPSHQWISGTPNSPVEITPWDAYFLTVIFEQPSNIYEGVQPSMQFCGVWYTP